MTEERITPKVCAICAQPLDQWQGRWIHTLELVGKSDHIAVPVDYDEVASVRTMCDFCYIEIPLHKQWVVLADDFKVPMVNHVSIGGWAACSECAADVQAARSGMSPLAERVEAIIERHKVNGNVEYDQHLQLWVHLLHDELHKHIREIRPWRDGDERSSI